MEQGLCFEKLGFKMHHQQAVCQPGVEQGDVPCLFYSVIEHGLAQSGSLLGVVGKTCKGLSWWVLLELMWAWQ